MSALPLPTTTVPSVRALLTPVTLVTLVTATRTAGVPVTAVTLVTLVTATRNCAVSDL